MLGTTAIIDMTPTVAITIIHMGFMVILMGIQAMGLMAGGITGSGFDYPTRQPTKGVTKRKEVKQNEKGICLDSTAAYMAEHDRWW